LIPLLSNLLNTISHPDFIHLQRSFGR
jgi:hypothetical protein